MGMLAVQGAGGPALEPLSLEAASDTAPVMSAFAEQARQLLDHDRLSVYLLTPNRQAFERFAVATSPIIPGEGIVIPFEDVGLRHIVITNRALVSEDLSADPRIVGREDRVIARAGFRGLLSAPLRREGRPIGVLNFVSKTPGFYREEDIPIAQQMADQVSAFLENLRRQRRMRALVTQEAAERERARLSRDLFDTVAQAVSETGAIATSLRERLAGVDPGAAEDVASIIELGNQELADIRRAVIGMSPRALEGHSLEDAAESTLARFRDATGLRTTWTIEGATSMLPATVEQSAYRILQEALNNVRLHSRAESVQVQLVVDEGLALVIEDDGVGFDPEAVVGTQSLGLQGMTERASALGGSFSIESAPGDGTRVRLEIPELCDAEAALPASQDGLPSAPEGDGGGTLRVFVAERNSLIRAGLTRILERTGTIRIVGEASSADQIRAQVSRLCPDVILLDEQLDAEHLLRLTRELKAATPSSSILITARGSVGATTELLDAGGTGIIHKSIEPDELVNAVRATANGSLLIAGSHGEGRDRGNGASLSKRQREILALVASGQTNAEIAEALFFATKTVERHVATIFGKLGARNRAHAAALAVSQQLIDLDDAGRG
jgi:signal transduction histidine kinase/DNA-binding NarL/FixJ family response regulator